MDYQSLIKRIQKNLTPSLLHRKYSKSKHPLSGHCYVASEAFYHLAGGKAAGFKPMFVKHEGQPHWWIQGPNKEVIDITAKQFFTPISYCKSIGKGFLTKQPSKRAKKLLDAMASINIYAREPI